MKRGVPGIAHQTVMEHYFDWHHSAADMLDKVVSIDATTRQPNGNGKAAKSPAAVGAGDGNRGGKPGGRRRGKYA